MARLTLQGGLSYRDLGGKMIDLANSRYNRSKEDMLGSEQEVVRLFREEIEVVARGEDPSGSQTEKPVICQFHYDQTREDGVRIVHIVVPDLEGKFELSATAGRATLNLRDVAAEAFAFAVILGCAS